MQEVQISKERITKAKQEWIKELDELLNGMREQRPLTPKQYGRPKAKGDDNAYGPKPRKFVSIGIFSA